MRVQKLEVRPTHEPFLSRSSRRKEAHSIVARSSGKRSEPRYLGCYVRFKFKAPIRVHQQMPATHEPDLRELETLGLLTPHPGPLPVEGRGSSSWSQCASKSWRSVLPMNLPLRSSRRQEAHSTPTRSSEKRSEPRYLGCYVRLVGSWSQCVCKSRWRLPMNRPSPGPAVAGPPSPIRPWLCRRLR